MRLCVVLITHSPLPRPCSSAQRWAGVDPGLVHTPPSSCPPAMGLGGPCPQMEQHMGHTPLCMGESSRGASVRVIGTEASRGSGIY